jgi:hypothetical protein
MQSIAFGPTRLLESRLKVSAISDSGWIQIRNEFSHLGAISSMDREDKSSLINVSVGLNGSQAEVIGSRNYDNSKRSLNSGENNRF